MNRTALVLASLAFASSLGAADSGSVGLPLPAAPVRLVIPDVPAFDGALGGGFRRVLTGTMEADDPVLGAWRQTQVGSKLEAQWEALSEDLAWNWNDVLATRARSMGIALLSAGSLEAVIVLDTPLAALPSPLPAGTAATHKGLTYALVTRGAGDGSTEDRRAGFAWARASGRLILATSERAMRLSLDEVAAGRGFAAPLPGLASLDLDLDALSKDLYFRREFLFPSEVSKGHVRAALRLEEGRIVEVREGEGRPSGTAYSFDARGASASGWEPDASRLMAALREGLLETVPRPADKPLAPLSPLPSPGAAETDRYLVDLTRPMAIDNAPWERGDLATWETLLTATKGWGWAVGSDGSRTLVLPWPAAQQQAFDGALVATLSRRAGRVVAERKGEITEYRVGPALFVLATRRTGEFLWISTSRTPLETAQPPRQAEGLVRWARLETKALRDESAHWSKAEGPASPDRIRPFSDRLLGLLGWMPQTATISVEKRASGASWTERVVFGPAAAR